MLRICIMLTKSIITCVNCQLAINFNILWNNYYGIQNCMRNYKNNHCVYEWASARSKSYTCDCSSTIHQLFLEVYVLFIVLLFTWFPDGFRGRSHISSLQVYIVRMTYYLSMIFTNLFGVHVMNFYYPMWHLVKLISS